MRFSLVLAFSAALAQTALVTTTRAQTATPPTIAARSGVETLGRARFTVITPNLVRLEDAQNGNFTDAPTLFATQRRTRFTDYRVQRDEKTLTIDTGALRLSYSNDGQPFSANNLKATIPRGNALETWTPGTPNSENLGGAATTLDGARGPFALPDGLLSRRGWYLLDDSGAPLLTPDWVAARPQNANTDWYLFAYGTNFRAALQSLQAVSGRVPMPRRVTMGAWYSRYWPYSSEDYREIAREYAQHDFPLDVMVLDMDWHRDGWTGWSWNRKLLPDAEKLLADLHAQGLAVTLNTHPADGVAPHEDAYPDFMRALKLDPESKQSVPFDAADKPYLDALFSQVHAPLERNGVDFWWLDWQQTRETRSISSLSNLAWLNKSYYEWTARDGNRGQSFSRWAGWGDHRYPMHFSGDADTGWRMLAFEVPFTSASGNTGCFFWSHDIGGHMGGRNEESYARWCQFGALSAALRSHSTRDPNTDRRPWKYAPAMEASMRASFHLRSELFPYIYTSAAQSAREFVPMLRPMYFDYATQEAAYHNGQEYTLGDNLLVAPIASPGAGPTRLASQIAWFPPQSATKSGAWFDWFSGERYNGGERALVSCDLNTMPLFARGGVPIPMQPYTARMTGTPLSTLRVRAFPGENGATSKSALYEDDGKTDANTRGQSAATSLSYTRLGEHITVHVGATEGKFDGQLLQRAFTIELPATLPARDVRVNNRRAKSRYNAQTHCNFVDVPAQSIREPLIVELRVAEMSPNELRRLAVLSRASGVLGRPIANVQDAVAAAPPDATALLAAFNVGFATANDAPYFHNGRETSRFFAPPSFPLRAKFASGVARPLASGDNFELNALAQLLPPREQIVVPGRSRVNVQVSLFGRDLTLSRPMFEALPISDNLARLANVQASSTQGGYNASGANDGIASGYPQSNEHEWASNQEKTGASLTLSWPQPVTIGRALLFDRPNPNDNVTGAILHFSDGSTEKVGELPNDGQAPTEITFAPRQTTFVKVEITSVGDKTENVGLSEVALFPK